MEEIDSRLNAARKDLDDARFNFSEGRLGVAEVTEWAVSRLK
ncbi:MAG: hypothetical protein QXH26_00585 [Candidatus Hadarchaeales archaeon]